MAWKFSEREQKAADLFVAKGVITRRQAEEAQALIDILGDAVEARRISADFGRRVIEAVGRDSVRSTGPARSDCGHAIQAACPFCVLDRFKPRTEG
jgi:hypothetical protein